MPGFTRESTFSYKQVWMGRHQPGNIVRWPKDKISESAMQELESKVREWGFHLIETSDHVIAVCNQGDVRVVV